MKYVYKLPLSSIIIMALNELDVVTNKFILIYTYPFWKISNYLGITMITMDSGPKATPEGAISVTTHMLPGSPVVEGLILEIPFIILFWFLAGYIIDKLVLMNKTKTINKKCDV